jgi:hypothetical protein
MGVQPPAPKGQGARAGGCPPPSAGLSKELFYSELI